MKVQLVVVRGKPEGKVIPLVGPKFQDRPWRDLPSSAQSASKSVVSTPSSPSSAGAVDRPRPGQPQWHPGERQGPDRCVPAQGPGPGASGAVDFCRLDRGCDRSAAVAGHSPNPRQLRLRRPKRHPMISPRTTSILGCSVPMPERLPINPQRSTAATRSRSSAFKDAAAPPKPAPTPAPASAATMNTSASPRTERVRCEIIGEQNSEEEDFENDEDETRPKTNRARVANPRGILGRIQPLLCRQESSKGTGQATGPAKPSFKDTSDAAGDILRRLMERRARRR